jgi:hypothetical protein
MDICAVDPGTMVVQTAVAALLRRRAEESALNPTAFSSPVAPC